MNKESVLAFMKDGLEFVRNLAVTAALVKLGGVIYYDPQMVGSENAGQLVGKFLIAVAVVYGAVSTGYIGWRHWPKGRVAKSVALAVMVAVVALVEGAFIVAARVADADHAHHRIDPVVASADVTGAIGVQ